MDAAPRGGMLAGKGEAMPTIDFSTLNVTELRRLSRAARGRGDGVLADQVDWEIAARQGHGGRPKAAPLPAPRPDDEPGSMEAALHAAPEDLEPEAAGAGWVRRGAGLVLAGVAAGAVVTAGGFWALGDLARPRAAPAAAPAPPAAPAARFAALPKALPVAVVDETPAEPERQEASRTPPHRTAAARPARTAARPDACAVFDTAAERLACSDPEIAGLARRVEEARLRAIVAGADRRVTDETEWRQARDGTTDRLGLAQLYQRRIRELDAGADAAREAEPIF